MAYKDKLKEKAAHDRYKANHREKRWASNALSHHRCQGMDIQITTTQLEDIAFHVRNCEYCGAELIYSSPTGRPLDRSASLDRIDNESIITPTNIRIVCRQCNATKLNRTFVEFVQYCKRIASKFEDEVV